MTCLVQLLELRLQGLLQELSRHPYQNQQNEPVPAAAPMPAASTLAAAAALIQAATATGPDDVVLDGVMDPAAV